jgi:hypothetical protein
VAGTAAVKLACEGLSRTSWPGWCQERLRALLPGIVRTEVVAYLEGVFGKGR